MANIKKNFGYQIAYRILTVITPLITSPIVSRALQADKLGVYSATYAYADYFVLLAMLGVASYGQRTIAAAKTLEERQKLFWEIYAVQFVASIVALSLYLLSLPIAALKVPDRIPVMLTQGLWIVSCIFSISWFFFGIEEFRVTVIRNLFIKERDYNYYVNNIFQKNKIELNEDGTIIKSVAIESGGYYISNAPPIKLEIKLNQPFIYIIKDKNKLPIYIGYINEPIFE